VCGASPARIADVIATFEEGRRSDLWSGVGLACAYAGGVGKDAIVALKDLAGDLRPELAQGAAFAAEARRHAGNPSEYSELACRVLCDCSASDAADVTVQALDALPADGEVPAFEVWRCRIRARFAALEAV
jgi:hypothetical protein